MTYLSKHMFDPFGMMDQFFQPTFTRRVSIDHNVLADKSNYSIWELPNGQHEVRVSYSDDDTTYHRASTKQTKEEAIDYVNKQVAYHARRVEGPKCIWSGKEDASN